MNDEAAIPNEHDLEHRAWLAYIVQELHGPAEQLLSGATELQRRSGNSSEMHTVTTTSRIAERANELVRQLNLWALPQPTPWDAKEWKTHRHDLRSMVGYIISATEDLAEDEDCCSLQPTLDQVRQSARHLLSLISTVVQFPSESKTEGDLAYAIRESLSTLPAAVAHAAKSADRTEPGHILLIDDNQYNRELVAAMLEAQGHTVESLAGGREAMTRMDANDEPAIDVIVCDLLMPGITGFDFLRWLKSHPTHWPIPIMMVSALGDDDGVLACITAGAEDYLTRPVRKELLRARLAGCLEKKRLRDREQAYQVSIDRLVRAIFPPAAVDEWQATGTIKARRYEKVGVLFTDISGFTAWCEGRRNEPEAVVEMLQSLIVRFEKIAIQHGVQKIKTIGDAFMAVAGLDENEENPALALLNCGRDLIRESANHPAGWGVRVGVHVGPVVSGVLGQTQFSFDVWGHTVNAAARMESNGVVGKITLSPEAFADVQDRVRAETREVTAKGIGHVTVYDVSPEMWNSLPSDGV
jgi:adenylate cyclase